LSVKKLKAATKMPKQQYIQKNYKHSGVKKKRGSRKVLKQERESVS